MQLAVNEIFGPTFQGEGPSLGRQATFLRLAGCNLKCTWCDTPYTWNWEQFDKQSETHLMTEDEVLSQLPAAPLLVVTGGEPMLQQKALQEILIWWASDIEIETNGTVQPKLLLNHLHYNVSPKLANSGDYNFTGYGEGYRAKLHPDYINLPEARFKFVASHVGDLDEIEAFELDPERVWVMPEGRNSFDLNMRAKAIAEEVLRRGWNLTTRLHVQLWGDQRGR